MDELSQEEPNNDQSESQDPGIDEPSAKNETETPKESNSPNKSESEVSSNEEPESINKEAPYGGSLSLARIQSLVSMTTPRDGGQPGLMGQVPPFVEFDLSIDGFGCLFLPSLFPQYIDQVSQ